MTVLVPPGFVEATINLTDVSPIDHIIALEHLHTDEMEIGSHHIIFLSHADDVGVGEVGIQHGVYICAVTLIAPGELTTGYNCRQGEDGEENQSFHRFIQYRYV